MSPAPVRERATVDRFPHGWGYGLGLVLIIAGIGVAIWGVVSAITGFRDDVNELRRVFGANQIEQSLDAGEEVVIYDEADVTAGPFDVTVIRTSDGAVVPTTSIDDGLEYDVDGQSGEARVGFRVPSSDIYRIEVDTSVGQIARFAVGGEITSQSSRIVQGLTIGAVLVIAGLLAMVWTLILHARWRVRHAVLDRVQRTRAVVTDAADSVSPEAQEQRVGEAGDRAAGWARERLDEARARLEAEGDHGRSPEWRQRLTDEARRRLDQADEALSSIEPAVSEQVSGSGLPDDLAGQVTDALDRIEQRLEAGESLRDIARDERVAAEDAARELADRAEVARAEADAARAEVEAEIADVRARTDRSVREQVRGLTTDLEEVASAAFESALSQTGDAGDDLATGLAATAATAGAAAGAAVTARGRDALGFEVDDDVEPEVASSLPAPPASSLPAPPSSSLPAPPGPSLPAPPSLPDPPPAELLELGPVEAEGAEPAAEPGRPEPSEPAVEPVAEPAPVAGARPSAPLASSVIAPPPEIKPLAPRPVTAGPPRTEVEDAAAADTTAAGGGAAAPPVTLDSFSALQPAPAAPLRARPLSVRPAPTIGRPDGQDPDEATEDADAPEDGAPAPDAKGPRTFTMAPPPDYAALGASTRE